MFFVDNDSMFIFSFCTCRIHPLNVLLALKAYEKGKLRNAAKAPWKVNADVVAALDCAFYKSFKVIFPLQYYYHNNIRLMANFKNDLGKLVPECQTRYAETTLFMPVHSSV